MKKYKSIFYFVAFANLIFFSGNSFYILLPIFLKQLGAPEAYIGFMYNADKLLVMFASIAIALFPRVKNKVIMIRIGYLILTITFISYLLISSLSWYIVLLRIFQGIGFSIAMIYGTNIVFDIVPLEDAVEAIGIYGITGAITNAISPFIGELIISKGYPFYYLFIISSILLFVAFCITFILPVPEQTVYKKSAEDRSGFFHLFANTRYTFITIAATIFGGGFGVILTYLPNFVLSTTKFQFSTFFICYIATLVIIRFKILGKLSKFNINRILIILFFIGALMNIFLNFLYSSLILIGIGIMYGMVHGILYPMLNTIVLSLVAENERNKVNALFNATFNGGMMLFSLPLGFLIDYTGTYLAAFNVSAFAFIVGIILLSFNAVKYGPIKIVRDTPVAVE